ncbi:MAG: alpha-hydroxy acid oxidase [Actinomycetota bacterium]
MQEKSSPIIQAREGGEPRPASLHDLEERAREVLPQSVFDFYAGGADDEETLRSNLESWAGVRLRPRILRGVTEPSTATTMLGVHVANPVAVAPTAFQKMAHPEGEVGAARGAAEAGAVFVLSTRSSMPLERVAEASGLGTRWFQVYVLKDRGWTKELVLQAADLGFSALVLTADAPLIGAKRREARKGFVLPDEGSMVNLGSVEFEGPIHTYSGYAHDPAITFDDIAWLRDDSGLPVVVKGVLRGDDAAACVEAGASAVVVSNHGGRQLDTAATSAEVLPEVVDAVGGKAEVYADGGIRRGTDVLKALALGARGVMIGRPALWGLALGGANGVREVLDAYRRELELAMVLCGVASLEQVTADLVLQ